MGVIEANKLAFLNRSSIPIAHDPVLALPSHVLGVCLLSLLRISKKEIL